MKSSKAKISFPRQNNFDVLRLVFAVQVMIAHMGIYISGFYPKKWVTIFPGVPGFFLISGFLVYASCERTNIKNYFKNRFLRIMPGLIFVTIGSLCILTIVKGFDFIALNRNKLLCWFIAQVTLGQAYNPEILRHFGTGVINGSLWTITVEILFYSSVPLLVWLDKRKTSAVTLLFFFSFLVFAFSGNVYNKSIYRDKTLYDFLKLTPIIWWWMFGVGLVWYKKLNKIDKNIAFIFCLALIFIIKYLNLEGPLFNSEGNNLGLVYFLAASGIIFFCAFNLPFCKLPFDISYGIYLWHMPLINLGIELSWHWSKIVFTTFIAALVSWFFVEKPFLKLKTNPMRKG